MIDYISATKNSTASLAAGQFIVNNGLTAGFQQEIENFDDIIECVDNITSGDDLFSVNLFTRLSIFICFLAANFYLSIKAIQSHNLIWNSIGENTYLSYFNIRTKCCSRLTDQLDIIEEEANLYYEYNREKKNEFHVNIRQIFEYFWHGLFFIAATSLYLSLFEVICSSSLSDSIYRKNVMLKTFYDISFYSARLDFYTISNVANVYGAVLDNEFLETTANYHKSILKLKDSDLDDIIKGNLYNLVFESYPGSVNLQTGLYKVSNLLLLDSFYIYSTKDRKAINCYSRKMNEVSNTTQATIELAIRNSDENITKSVSGIYTAVGFYMAFCIVLYLAFYLPALHAKMQTLKKLRQIFKLLLLQKEIK